MGMLRRFAARALSHGKDLLFRKERSGFAPFCKLFDGQIGLEIGGPSAVFRARDILPVYSVAARIDGVNFATNTLWQTNIREGMGYRYTRARVGRQYVCEASNLDRIADATYDFVLASHCLEHSANPIRCVREWLRVLKPGAPLLLLLPDQRFTFDHRRPVTAFEHLLDDYRENKGEDDMTHLDEILALHDLARDAGAGDAENFRERSLRNFANRGLHQHVFNAQLIERLLGYFGVQQIYADVAPPHHLIALGLKAANVSP